MTPTMMFRGFHKDMRGTLTIFDGKGTRHASWVPDDPSVERSAMVEYLDTPFILTRDRNGKFCEFEWDKRKWRLDIRIEITSGTRTFAQVMVGKPVGVRAVGR